MPDPATISNDDLAQSVHDLKAKVTEYQDGSISKAEFSEQFGKIETAIQTLQRDAKKVSGIPEFSQRLSRAFNGKTTPGDRAKTYDDLISKRTRSNGASDSSEADLIEDTKAKSDEVFIKWHAAMESQRRFGTHSGLDPGEVLKSLKATKELGELQREIIKSAGAFETQTANWGLEWVPTGLSTQITQKTEAALEVAALFDSFRMPTSPYEWPFMNEHAEARKSTENTTVPTNYGTFASSYSGSPTGKVTFTAVKTQTDAVLSGEFDEDTIGAALGSLSTDIAMGHTRALEKAIIRGDDGAAHMDDDISETGTDAAVLWEGLRHYATQYATGALINGGGGGTASGDTLIDKIVDMMVAMGPAFGKDIPNLALIMSMLTFGRILKSDRVMTLDKFGPSAVILRGQIGAVLGIPVVVSAYVRNDIDTTGIHDGTTTENTHGATSILMPWRRGFKLGIRRAPSFETLRIVPADQQYMVSFMRSHFRHMHATSELIVGMIKNIDGS